MKQIKKALLTLFTITTATLITWGTITLLRNNFENTPFTTYLYQDCEGEIMECDLVEVGHDEDGKQVWCHIIKRINE